MSLELREKKCEACEAGVKPMQAEEVKNKLNQLPPDWEVQNNHTILKTFPFENFKRGMSFAQDVAFIAEEEQHHPSICIAYTNVKIALTTHAINGLSENDFIMAAKIEEL